MEGGVGGSVQCAYCAWLELSYVLTEDLERVM